MKKAIRLALICFLIFSAEAYSQTKEETAVIQVIKDLFEGMRRGDSTMVASLFHPDVRMLTSFRDSSGEPLVKEGSLQTFLTAIGTPHPEVWNEKIWNIEVRIDDDLAQVWTDYAFFIGEKFSHCGVDAFHLVRHSDGTWRIIHLIDTRRKEPCDLP